MEEMRELLEIMERLRDPQKGCAWDVKQSFGSIAPYTIEEAYEVADAIAREDYPALRDELGDLLLQVVFHAQIAQEKGLFDYREVVQSITEKMIRRHPHVFADTVFESEALQRQHWEQLKSEERASNAAERISAIDDVALALPALTRAEKIQKRAARVGFDWQALDPVMSKVDEELAELRAAIFTNPPGQTSVATLEIEDELGDLLFATTNVARHLKVDPEQALKNATTKFETRFRHVESAVIKDGLNMADVSDEVLDRYWEAAKKET